MDKHVTAGNSHVGSGTQWYDPVLAGAQTLARFLFREQTYRGVSEVLSSLSDDAYARFVREYITKGLARFGPDWRYADICTVLHALSGAIGFADYLDIGVRRGRSMAMVAANCPDARIVGCDIWLENYAGMHTPGPEFVADELARLGFKGEIVFVNGNSHQTVPEFFDRNPERTFDCITVDGDHTAEGAMADLMTVLPRLRVGGVLVFDDICHPKHRYLLNVWRRAVGAKDEFSCFEFTELGYGVAFAVRKRPTGAI